MAGNRLAGDDGERHESDARAETRLSGDLAGRFETFQAESGVSDAQLLRDALDSYLPESDTNPFVVPPEPELRDAYLALAGPEKRIMKVEQAKDRLSNTACPSKPKDLMKRDVLRPLDSMGFIGVAFGRVAIKPLTPREEPADDGDDADGVAEEWDRLESAERGEAAD